jgi:hypothetical protein
MDERACHRQTGQPRRLRSRVRLPRPVALAAGLAAGLAVALVVTVAPAAAGAGGGDFMDPARDRYEPGQTVTMIGYGVAYADPEATWRHEPFYGYLRAGDPDPAAPFPGRSGAFPGLRVGTVTVQEVPPDDGRDLRVSIEFSLPDDLPPGMYLVGACTAGCARDLGWFLPSELWVGIDPPYAVVRDWPLTDPAIRWLEPGALLSGPDGRPVTAADVRAGRVPPAPAEATAPSAQPQALPEVTASPATSRPAQSPAARPGFGPARGSQGGHRPEGARAAPDVVAADASGDDRGEDGTPVPWLVGAAIVALAAGVALRPRSRTRQRAGREVAPVPLPAPGAGGPDRDRDHAEGRAGGVGDDVGTRTRVRL